MKQRTVKRGRNKQQHEYLVKWKGYPEWEMTWEPLRHLAGAKQLLEEFLESRAAAERPKRH